MDDLPQNPPRQNGGKPKRDKAPWRPNILTLLIIVSAVVFGSIALVIWKGSITGDALANLIQVLVVGLIAGSIGIAKDILALDAKEDT